MDIAGLKATLYGYQLFGARFAVLRRRCILGDEMGLGKTVQALAAVVHLAATGPRRFLVVCPLTLMGNWVQEIAKHTDLQDAAARLAVGGASVDAEEFRRRVAPVYLRRNVEDVLTELPNKIEIDDWVLPSARDLDAYRGAVATRDAMAMRQATFDHGSEKLERLEDIVKEARDDGRKVIVFSYFHRVLDIASARLGDGVVGRLDGNTPAARRQGLIDDFTGKAGHAVLLAQIETGGEGLNIQAASVVVITEPQWRPSKEEQAVARAHRMGRVGVVQVHRLLAKDTIDERIREKQAEKIAAFDRYARPSDTKDADPRAIDPAERAEMVEAEYRRLGL
ncbi:DEAD/DEAH box helicase [Actinosynnema sp. NPDC059335]|uniref:DEAD/DEAH box helicase n=1 Tax=Actinosynnema sp. NPDC059335 TaxID=3346804 RepID=UPI003671619A